MPTDFYQQLDHTGDCGIEVFARDQETLFANAARAFSDLLIGLEYIKRQLVRNFEVSGDDQESLLVNWLDELLFAFETEGEVYCDYVVESLSSTRISAAAYGEPYRPEHHSYKVAIKAVTFHQLTIAPTDEGWMARIIFDL